MTTGHSLVAAVLLPLAFLAAACGGNTGQGSGGTGGGQGGKAGANGTGAAGRGGEAGRGGMAGLGSAGGGGHAGGPGGTTTAGTAGRGAAGTPGTAGTTGAGGQAGGPAAGGAGGATSSTCALATDGAACTSEGAICGGPCTDACQFCNLLSCSGGHWLRAEAFPAPCFACGNGKCQTLTQYCQTTIGGVPGSVPSYACLDIPSECLSSRTCVCLGQQHVGGSCSMGANGELMTLLAAP